MIPSSQQVLHLTRPGLVLEQCVQRSLTAPCQMLVVTPPPPQLPHGRHLQPITGEDRGHVTMSPPMTTHPAPPQPGHSSLLATASLSLRPATSGRSSPASFRRSSPASSWRRNWFIYIDVQCSQFFSFISELLPLGRRRGGILWAA